MIKNIIPIRPGMTAIAAVLALSSTPLLAQEIAPQTTAPPTVTAPVQVTPPLVVPTVPAPSTAMTPAPTPVIALPQTVTPAPVIAEEAPVAAPVARAEAPARAAPRQAAVTPRAAAPVAAPIVAEPAVTPAPAEIAAAPAPVEVAPAPVEQVPVTAEGPAVSDAMLLGGAGLAVLALGAAGFALTRRRRRDEAFGEAETALVYDEPVAEPPVAEPAFVESAPRRAFAFAATAPADEGRHVAAAHAGPSEANPFVSLKKRLKRARFLDMQEAQATEPATMPAAAPAFATAAPSRYEERRFEPAKRSQPLRPAFQY